MSSAPLRLHALFHLNLAYSSIEEEQRPLIIERCYWPLLRLAADLGLPLGIEASGYTLECIEALDSKWVPELKRLCTNGPCEFIGTGYSQLIGPLVPAAVNAANQRLGMEAYRRLLGFQPELALVSEQAYSAGMVAHYLDAGYRAIAMEWDNPARYHPEWPSEWRYLPQIALGTQGTAIDLLWTHSIAFQKFQRYAHGEITLGDYLEYIEKHLSPSPRVFPVYSNDAEIFDFRPGRYGTEAPLGRLVEWDRIRSLFKALLRDERYLIVPPRDTLPLGKESGGGNRLHLESPGQPVPVKKQDKYNVTRWAATGRADLHINTLCWGRYRAMEEAGTRNDEDWRELCYLWSSDFRTHITEKRWADFTNQWLPPERMAHRPARIPAPADGRGGARSPQRSSQTNGRFLIVRTPAATVRFDQFRGLAIDALTFPSLGPDALCGTIPHGYFDDIGWGADFFSSHLVMEMPGRPKVTDLQPVHPVVEDSGDSPWVQVSASLSTPLGPIQKHYRIYRREAQVELVYHLDWEEVPIGSLRLGYVTLQPAAFGADSLYYRTHNGGFDPETFPLSRTTVDHGGAVSFLVSARQAMGVTTGVVELGDARRGLRVEVDKSLAALVAMVTYREVGGSYFFSLAFSAGEMDDTSRSGSVGGPEGCRTFRFAISAL